MGFVISTAMPQRTRDSENGAESIPNNGAESIPRAFLQIPTGIDTCACIAYSISEGRAFIQQPPTKTRSNARKGTRRHETK